jgi:predicted RNase H-like nuclease (RuvC/YqgF family)
MSSNFSKKDTYRIGYAQLKTPIKCGITTKSRPVRSDHLEIYVLEKHRLRLKQERANISRRIDQIDAELSNINERIYSMKTEVEQDICNMSHENITNSDNIKTLRKMPLNY